MTKIENGLGIGYDVLESELREALELLYQKREREKQKQAQELKEAMNYMHRHLDKGVFDRLFPNIELTYELKIKN